MLEFAAISSSAISAHGENTQDVVGAATITPTYSAADKRGRNATGGVTSTPALAGTAQKQLGGRGNIDITDFMAISGAQNRIRTQHSNMPIPALAWQALNQFSGNSPDIQAGLLILFTYGAHLGRDIDAASHVLSPGTSFASGDYYAGTLWADDPNPIRPNWVVSTETGI